MLPRLGTALLDADGGADGLYAQMQRLKGLEVEAEAAVGRVPLLQRGVELWLPACVVRRALSRVRSRYAARADGW